MGTGIRSRSPPMSKFCSDLCVCAPHSLPGTEHNSPNRQINRTAAASRLPRHEQIKTTRDELDQPNGAARYLRGEGEGEGEEGATHLSLGTWMGPKVSRSSRKPVEIGRVSAGRRSSAAAAAATDGEPGTPARRRRAVAISGDSLLRGSAARRVDGAAAGEWGRGRRGRPGRWTGHGERVRESIGEWV